MSGSVRKAVLSLYAFELGLVLIGGAAASYILIGGGRLLYPFIFLVLAFVTLLGLSMRGSGVAPTARKAAP
jgi:hypothetical protein